MDEQEFQALYGRWQPFTPAEVRGLLARAPFRWWLAGGWALELAGAPPRRHEDIDVGVSFDDLEAVREAFRDFHLWEAHEGLRPLLPGEELRAGREQLWVRSDASHPWRADIVLTPTRGGRWVFKKGNRITLPLDNALAAKDGIEYLPEHWPRQARLRLLCSGVGQAGVSSGCGSRVASRAVAPNFPTSTPITTAGRTTATRSAPTPSQQTHPTAAICATYSVASRPQPLMSALSPLHSLDRLACEALHDLPITPPPPRHGRIEVPVGFDPTLPTRLVQSSVAAWKAMHTSTAEPLAASTARPLRPHP